MGAVLSAFRLPGSPRRLTPIAGAWSHRVFRLDTNRGQYAVKQLMNPWGADGWREWLDEAWEFELAACDAGVSMPRPLPTRDDACLADVESFDGQSHVPVRLHEWVDARRCPPRPVDDQVGQVLGEDLAKMHALHHLPGREDVFPTVTRAGVDGWPGLIERLRGRGEDVARQAAEVSEWVSRIGEMFDAADTDYRGRPMSHGDVDQKNLLLSAAGPVLCDWDVAAPWAPRAELVRSAMSLADWERPDIARSTIAAYRRAGGDGSAVTPDDLIVDLVVGLDWLCVCLERATGLRQADEQRRKQSRQVLPHLIKQLPQHVDTTLDIASWIGGDTPIRV